MKVLGIDIGGSGIKGAVVDTQKGEMITDRVRFATPEPSTPDAVADVVNRLVKQLNWEGLIGCGFPSVVIGGVVWTAANIDSSWIGTNGEEQLQKYTGCKVFMVNDADAAGIAEMEFGAGRDCHRGVVLVSTLGTGIGSAFFTDGILLPNTELGHMEIRGKDAEKRASAFIRKKKRLSYRNWAVRLQEYYGTIERLFWPDLIIIGGGVSKDARRFIPLLKLRAKVVPALMQNEAGIIGAALYAAGKTGGQTNP
jgi:polyphosphate glucokinase